MYYFFGFSAIRAEFILDYWNKSDDFWDSLRSSQSSQSSESVSIWSLQNLHDRPNRPDRTQLYPSDRGRLSRPGRLRSSESRFVPIVWTFFETTGTIGMIRTIIWKPGYNNHDDDFVDDDRKWVTEYCASATSKFRRRGLVDVAKQSRITSSCNPQALAGINPLF